MKASEVRNWLGLYVLIFTGVMGAYLLLAPPILLPLERADRVSCFEIITPFLLGQLAAVFRYFSDANEADGSFSLTMPRWVVIGPPILVSLIMVVAIALMAMAGVNYAQPPSAEDFKGLLTFCVAILNASTVFVLAKYFETKSQSRVDIAASNGSR